MVPIFIVPGKKHNQLKCELQELVNAINTLTVIDVVTSRIQTYRPNVSMLHTIQLSAVYSPAILPIMSDFKGILDFFLFLPVYTSLSE